MTKKEEGRRNRLLPNNIPRYVRCYDDNGGSADRYTVVFTGTYNNIGKPKHSPTVSSIHYYIGMSGAPYHPQGICQHGESEWRCIDVNDKGFAPAIGRKNHLGKRISWDNLPDDCKQVVTQDYKEIWDLE